MSAFQLLLALFFANNSSAWSNCTLTRILTTTTDLVIETPAWIYPFHYAPCETCPPSLITGLNQPITSQSVHDGTTTNYIAPWWDWNFRPTKTVTVMVDTAPHPIAQVQTWFAKQPTYSSVPRTTDNTVIHKCYYERVVEYIEHIVEDSDPGYSYPITFTSTSVVVSTFTTTIEGNQHAPSQQPAGASAPAHTSNSFQQDGQLTFAGGGPRAGSGQSGTTYTGPGQLASAPAASILISAGSVQPNHGSNGQVTQSQKSFDSSPGAETSFQPGLYSSTSGVAQSGAEASNTAFYSVASSPGAGTSFQPGIYSSDSGATQSATQASNTAFIGSLSAPFSSGLPANPNTVPTASGESINGSPINSVIPGSNSGANSFANSANGPSSSASAGISAGSIASGPSGTSLDSAAAPSVFVSGGSTSLAGTPSTVGAGTSFPQNSAGSSASVSSVALSAVGSSTTLAPSTTSAVDQTFQLFVQNNVEGLDTLAVGESGTGQLIVGGVVNATVLTINNATNMSDLHGNYIFFMSKAAMGRLHRRQDDDPTLQYDPDPPADAVTSGFSLKNITLASNSTDGNYTFYTCSTSPDAQPIYVAEVGKTPGRCYNFDLVTTPPPLNNTNTTSSSSFDTSRSSTSSLSGIVSSPFSSGPVSTTGFSSSASSSDSSGSSGMASNSNSLSSDTASITSSSSTGQNPGSLSSGTVSISISSAMTSILNSNSGTLSSDIVSSGISSRTSSSSSSKTTSQSGSGNSSPTLVSPSGSLSPGAVSTSSIGITSSSGGSLSSTADSELNSLSSATSTVSSVSSADTPSTSAAAVSSTSSVPATPSVSAQSAGTISTGQAASSSIGSASISSESALPSSSASPTVVDSAGRFVNRGLFDDPSTAQVLDAISTSGPSMSVDVCALFCSSYLYFGVEDGDTCYCGDSFSSSPSPASDQSGSSDSVCEGDRNEYCGGSQALQVYAVSSLASSSLAVSSSSTPAPGSSGQTSSSSGSAAIQSSSFSLTLASDLSGAQSSVAAQTSDSAAASSGTKSSSSSSSAAQTSDSAAASSETKSSSSGSSAAQTPPSQSAVQSSSPNDQSSSSTSSAAQSSSSSQSTSGQSNPDSSSGASSSQSSQASTGITSSSAVSLSSASESSTPSSSDSSSSSSSSSSSTTASPATTADSDLVASATSIIESSSLYPFCSQLLGYTTPVASTTETIVQTSSTITVRESTISTTVTSTQTQTFSVTVPSSTFTPLTTTTGTAYKLVQTTTRVTKRALEGRAGSASTSSISTPSALATFPASIVSSACSEEATPVSLTSTAIQSTTMLTTATYSSTSISTVVSTSTQTSTTTQTISSGIKTNPTSIITSTNTVTSTTTITFASGAPSSTPYYLAISPDGNAGAGWALSDSATHMTDNYFAPSKREVFELTSANQLYSVTANAWYGTITGQTSGKLFWNTNSQYANSTFTGTALTDGTGRVELFLGSSVFCVANVLSADDNTATGYHVYFQQMAGQVSTNCITCSLYLSPIGNG